MHPTTELLKKIETLCRKDKRYKSEAYLFLLGALHFTTTQLKEPRHVSGKELLDGIRLYGLEQFGPLAVQVFEHWGVTTTEDFGHLVFNLVSAKLLGKTEEDTLEDFKEIYDFDSAFDSKDLFKLADE